MINELNNKKIAIVTGASTGIGRATALALSKEGYTILLLARNEIKLNETKNLINEIGNDAIVYKIDLNDTVQILDFVNYVKSITSRVDAIINVAGIWHNENIVFANTDFDKFDASVITQTFNVGITAPALLVHGLISLMPKGSSIVNVSGTFENGAKGWLPYYVSKKAIEDLTIGLAEELNEKQIFVNCVSPSDTSTDEYKKYFPEYISESISPEIVASEIVNYCIDKTKNAEIKVIKKLS